jgi:hypothetical protein
MTSLRRAAALVVAVALSLTAATPALAADSGSTKVALTSSGQLLRSFEGLLKHRYGSRQVCATYNSGRRWHFTSGSCVPAATFEPYVYTFASPINADLRLSTYDFRKLHVGRHLHVVLVAGHPLACTRRPGTFLVSAEPFSLKCSTPGGRTYVDVPTRSTKVALTTEGRLTREFEALLRQRVGSREVCAHRNRDQWDLNSTCWAQSLRYAYTFTATRKTPLHTSRRTYPVSQFGNAQPLLVGGREVASSAHPGEILVEIPTFTTFTLTFDTPR